MTDTPFDTMATVRLLRASGIEERQAEAIAAAIRDCVTGGFATGPDIAAAKADVARRLVEIWTDPKWIKLIALAVPAILLLQRLAELAAAMH
ncbi:MAG: hypothetical protein F4X99_11360 [Gammaproteobacteria bacterium]|nr:hypothetical protein [Gammaproteobacteria bacterium]